MICGRSLPRFRLRGQKCTQRFFEGFIVGPPMLNYCRWCPQDSRKRFFFFTVTIRLWLRSVLRWKMAPFLAREKALRELWFSYCSSRERPFREWNFAFWESLSEFREVLREYPRTLRDLRKWPFHSESVFLKLGWSPGFWKCAARCVHSLRFRLRFKKSLSCRRCLRFLVLEPQTDHAEPCEIMADQATSRPWKSLKVPDSAWKCLILPENAWFCSLRMAESAWCPESPRTMKHTLVFKIASDCGCDCDAVVHFPCPIWLDDRGTGQWKLMEEVLPSYLACTPCVPWFSTLFDRGGNRRAFRLPGTAGIISIVCRSFKGQHD